MAQSPSERRRGLRRVLIVEDSGLMRAMLRELVESMSGFAVVGEAETGYQAIRLVHELNPDIVTLDLQMPELGGAETLSYIMREAPRPVVLVSSHSRALVEPALNALLHGALDFVHKPVAGVAGDMERFADRLQQSLRAAAFARLAGSDRDLPPPTGRHEPAAARPARCAVAIACSTGGPRALTEIVPRLPARLHAAVFIAQHMPPMFTAALARRLHESSGLTVREAEDGEPALEGVVYLAPGGRHLELEHGDGVILRVNEKPPVWGVRPCADLLFKSVARTFGPASVGAVLTGMGRDGAEGLRAIRDVGGETFCQDEETAVIASMPRAAAKYAQRIVPLHDVSGTIAERVELAATRRR